MLKLFFRFLSQIACLLPRHLSLLIGTLVADGLYAIYRLSTHRQFIYNNIQSALHLSPKLAHRLAREHVRRLVCSIVDLMRFSLLADQIDTQVSLSGFHHFIAAHRLGRGVVLVSAHYGCWELIAAIIALSGIPMHVLVQRPGTKAFDELFNEYRSYVKIITHYNTEIQGLKPLLRALKRNEVIAMLVDQHGENQQCNGQFFGHLVSFPTGPTFFARYNDSPIVPVFSSRTVHNKHIIRFYPPLFCSSNPESIMQTIYDLMEAVIRIQPEDWLWSYNRWDKLNV